MARVCPALSCIGESLRADAYNLSVTTSNVEMARLRVIGALLAIAPAKAKKTWNGQGEEEVVSGDLN